MPMLKTSGRSNASDAEERAIRAQARIDAISQQACRIQTSVTGGDIIWHVWGSGSPLVLVHGGSGSWTHWISNIETLARHFCLLVPDLPGCGASHVTHLPDNGSDLAKLLRQGLEQILPRKQHFAIASFSFGGIVSAFLAMQMPERVSGFLMSGGVGLGIDRCSRPRIRPINPDMSITDRWQATRQNLEAMMLAQTKRIDDLAIHIHEQNCGRNRLRSSAISRTDPLKGLISKIPCPLFFVWGACENLYSSDQAQRINLSTDSRYPSRPHFIASCGHWVPYEAPQEFNNHLVTCLTAP